MLVSPEGHKFHNAVKFGFTASNNEAEYEALLAGLRLARSVQARAITVTPQISNFGIVPHIACPF